MFRASVIRSEVPDDRQRTLSFTERHHRFLLQKVNEGVFAT